MFNFLHKKTKDAKDIIGEREKNLATKSLWYMMANIALENTTCCCGLPSNSYKIRALRTHTVVMINDDGDMLEEWVNTLRCSCMYCGKITFIDVDD